MSIRFAFGKKNAIEQLNSRYFSPSKAIKYVIGFPFLFFLSYLIIFSNVPFGLIFLTEIVVAIVIFNVDKGAKPSFANLLTRYSFTGFVTYFTYVLPVLIVVAITAFLIQKEYGGHSILKFLPYISFIAVMYGQVARINIHKNLIKSDHEEKVLLGSLGTFFTLVDQAMKSSKEKDSELFNRDFRMIICPGCGKTTSAASKKCPFCNETLIRAKVKCPSCNAINFDNAEYCLLCGKFLKGEGDRSSKRPKCPSCKMENAIGTTRCFYCGSSMTKEPLADFLPGKCEKCGFDNEGDVTYCMKCGSVFSDSIPTVATKSSPEEPEEILEPGTCAECGYINGLGITNCFQCGAKLADTEIAEIIEEEPDKIEKTVAREEAFFTLDSEEFAICNSCSAINESDNEFCFNCGKNLEAPTISVESKLKTDKKPQPIFGIFCPHCDAGNSEDSVFCFNCGKPLRKEIKKEGFGHSKPRIYTPAKHHSRAPANKSKSRDVVQEQNEYFAEKAEKRERVEIKRKSDSLIKEANITALAAKKAKEDQLKIELEIDKKKMEQLELEQEKLFESYSAPNYSTNADSNITKEEYKTDLYSVASAMTKADGFETPSYVVTSGPKLEQPSFDKDSQMACPSLTQSAGYSQPSYEKSNFDDTGTIGPIKEETPEISSPPLENLYAKAGLAPAKSSDDQKRREKVCRKCKHFRHRELLCAINEKPVYQTYCYSLTSK